MFSCCCTAPEDKTTVQHIPVYSTLEEPPAAETGAVVQQAEEEQPPPKEEEPAPAPEPPAPPPPKVEEKIAEPEPAPAPEPTPAPEPEPQAVQFEIQLDKKTKEEALGADLDIVGSSCAMIIKVSGGAAANYNKSAPPDKQLQPGDFIMSVNGVSNNTARMAQETNHTTKLKMAIKRPVEFAVELDKSSSPGVQFGIGVDFIATGRSVLIKKIDDGLIKNWNKANPTKEVKLFDRIVAVNDFRGDPDKMLDMCAKLTTVTFKVVRV